MSRLSIPLRSSRMEPIGRHVSRVGRALGRAFDAALAETGGSLSTWLVVLSLKQARWRTQQELARAVGIQSPTLTRHLDNLEQAGLVARSRDPDDRRIMRIELTGEGDEAFNRMRQAAAAFDERLRAGFSDGELEVLRQLLTRLEANAGSRE